MPPFSLVGERPQILRRLAATGVAGGYTFTFGPVAVSNFGRLTAVFHLAAGGAPAAGYPRIVQSVDGVSQDLIVEGTLLTSQSPEIVYSIDVALTLPYVIVEFTNSGTATTLSYLVQVWATPATTTVSGGGGGGGGVTCTLMYLDTTPLEIGEDLVNPTFDATYSGTPTVATLDDTDANPQQNVLAVPNPITRPYTYNKTTNGGTVVFTLTTDGGNTSSQTVTWLPLAYWGVSALPILNAAQVQALSGSALASARATSFTLSPANEYVYYAFPDSFGNASPTDFSTPPPFTGGWVEMAGSPIAITATTAGAPVQNYRVWRTINPLTAGGGVLTQVT